MPDLAQCNPGDFPVKASPPALSIPFFRTDPAALNLHDGPPPPPPLTTAYDPSFPRAEVKNKPPPPKLLSMEEVMAVTVSKPKVSFLQHPVVHDPAAVPVAVRARGKASVRHIDFYYLRRLVHVHMQRLEELNDQVQDMSWSINQEINAMSEMLEYLGEGDEYDTGSNDE